MKIGDILKFGEISFIDYEKCFVQFCDPGSKGVYGVFSMTFEDLKKAMSVITVKLRGKKYK